MRRFLPLALLLVATVPASRADVIVTYDFSGVQTDYGSSLTGSLTFDTTVGDITAIDAIYTTPLNGGQVNTFDTATTPGDLGDQGTFFNDGYVVFVDSDQGTTTVPGGSQLALLLPYESLAGYPGSLACAYNYGCNDVISTFYTYSATAMNNSTTDIFCTGGIGETAVAGGCTGGPNQPVIGAATAATPEPSSLMLLGTGVAGMAGVLRRRMRR